MERDLKPHFFFQFLNQSFPDFLTSVVGNCDLFAVLFLNYVASGLPDFVPSVQLD